MEKIEIQYLSNVPEDIANVLKNSYETFAEVSLHRRELPRYDRNKDNYHEKIIEDIIIYFHDNQRELLNDLIIATFIRGIELAYHKLTKIRRTLFNAKSSSTKITIKQPDVEADFKLSGKLSDSQIQRCYTSLNNLLSSGKLQSDYNNPDYHGSGEVKRMYRVQPLPHQFDPLQYRCDIKSGLWIPRDFAAEARETQKTIEELGDKNLY